MNGSAQTIEAIVCMFNSIKDVNEEFIMGGLGKLSKNYMQMTQKDGRMKRKIYCWVEG